MDHARRPRILLGNLGPIMRMGMRRVLMEQGCEVVGQEGNKLEIDFETSGRKRVIDSFVQVA